MPAVGQRVDPDGEFYVPAGRWHLDSCCAICDAPFGFLRRRHHCRNCGVSVCDRHSRKRAVVPVSLSNQPQRICDNCVPVCMRASPRRRARTFANRTEGRNCMTPNPTSSGNGSVRKARSQSGRFFRSRSLRETPGTPPGDAAIAREFVEQMGRDKGWDTLPSNRRRAGSDGAAWRQRVEREQEQQRADGRERDPRPADMAAQSNSQHDAARSGKSSKSSKSSKASRIISLKDARAQQRRLARGESDESLDAKQDEIEKHTRTAPTKLHSQRVLSHREAAARFRRMASEPFDAKGVQLDQAESTGSEDREQRQRSNSRERKPERGRSHTVMQTTPGTPHSHDKSLRSADKVKSRLKRSASTGPAPSRHEEARDDSVRSDPYNARSDEAKKADPFASNGSHSTRHRDGSQRSNALTSTTDETSRGRRPRAGSGGSHASRRDVRNDSQRSDPFSTRSGDSKRRLHRAASSAHDLLQREVKNESTSREHSHERQRSHTTLQPSASRLDEHIARSARRHDGSTREVREYLLRRALEASACAVESSELVEPESMESTNKKQDANESLHDYLDHQERRDSTRDYLFRKALVVKQTDDDEQGPKHQSTKALLAEKHGSRGSRRDVAVNLLRRAMESSDVRPQSLGKVALHKNDGGRWDRKVGSGGAIDDECSRAETSDADSDRITEDFPQPSISADPFWKYIDEPSRQLLREEQEPKAEVTKNSEVTVSSDWDVSVANEEIDVEKRQHDLETSEWDNSTLEQPKENVEVETAIREEDDKLELATSVSVAVPSTKEPEADEPSALVTESEVHEEEASPRLEEEQITDEARHLMAEVEELELSIQEHQSELSELLDEWTRSHQDLETLRKSAREAQSRVEQLQNARVLVGRAIRQATKCLQGNEHEAAILELVRAAAIEPTNAKVWYLLAEARMKVGEFKEAEEASRVCIELQDSPVTQHQLGRILQEQHRLSEAIACFQRALL